MNGPERRDDPERDRRSRNEREAISRATHPSRWAPPGAQRAGRPDPDPGPAAHVEHAAVAWLARHRHFLDPDQADDSTRLFARKALVETSLLVGLRARLDPRPLESPYEDLLDCIADVAGRPSYRELVNRDRRALLLYAGTYAALRLCGRDDVAFRHAIERTVAGRYATSFERVPYRQLDLLHTLELAGIDLAGPGLADTVARTLLVSDPNALELSNPDVYAITHAVFYASDFGQRPVPWPAGTTQAAVIELIEECLLLARSHEDADLVGELLICLTCLHAPSSPITSSARRWLRGWQESDGRLEGPAGVIPDRLLRADPAWGSWATAYHTTIVAALESLLLRTSAPAIEPGMDLHPRSARPSLPDELAASIAAAARWLDTAVPGPHVRGRLWSTEAWLAVGDEAEARRQIELLAADPRVAFAALRESGDVAVHLAALVVGLGVHCEPLEDLLGDVAALLASADPTDTYLDGARARVAGARRQPWRPGGEADLPMPAADADLRAASLALCSDLLTLGPAPALRPRTADQALLQLARSAHAAVGGYDVAWLAVVLRGLHRMAGAPARLVRDATDFLIAQQGGDGAIGAPAVDDEPTRHDLLVQWTLLALPALVEAAPAPHLDAVA